MPAHFNTYLLHLLHTVSDRDGGGGRVLRAAAARAAVDGAALDGQRGRGRRRHRGLRPPAPPRRPRRPPQPAGLLRRALRRRQVRRVAPGE